MSGGDGSLFLCCVKTWNGMGWDGRFGLAVIGSTIKSPAASSSVPR